MATKRVFVSYSRADTEQVKLIVDELTAQGLHLWVDYRDLKSGQNWRTTIYDTIIASDVFLACLSPKAIASSQVRKEIFLAHSYKKQIIPVLLTNCFGNLSEHNETKA